MYLSPSTYNKQWAEAQTSLTDLLVTENIPTESRKPERVFILFTISNNKYGSLNNHNGILESNMHTYFI